MSLRIFTAITVCILAIFCAIGCSSKGSQSRHKERQAQPASKTAAASESASKVQPKPDERSAAPLVRPTAPELLSKLQQAYKRMPSLKIRGTSETLVSADGKPLAKPRRQAVSLLFKRPNRMIIDTMDGRLTADGRSVYDYRLAAKQYTKGPLTQELLKRLATSKPDIGVIGLLFGNDYRKVITAPRFLPDARVGSHEVYVLTFALKRGEGAPEGVSGKQTLWIGKTDLGLYRNQTTLTVDTRILSRNAPKGPSGKAAKVIETTTTNELTSFQSGIKLPDTIFRFKPPAGARQFKVADLMGLLNKPAPDFAFAAANGTARKLSDLKGKFVLLDFWGLPMCDPQLPILESLSRSLKPDTELVAINLNGDRAAVADYLSKKGNTFPVVYADQQIARVAGEKYNVRALPTMMIVDKQGVVRAQFLGLATQKQIEDRLNSLR